MWYCTINILLIFLRKEIPENISRFFLWEIRQCLEFMWIWSGVWSALDWLLTSKNYSISVVEKWLSPFTQVLYILYLEFTCNLLLLYTSTPPHFQGKYFFIFYFFYSIPFIWQLLVAFQILHKTCVNLIKRSTLLKIKLVVQTCLDGDPS